LFDRPKPTVGCSASGRRRRRRRIIHKPILIFLISNFGRVLNVVFFLLGASPAPEFYMPSVRNTLFHLHRWCKHTTIFITYEDGTVCSETSSHKIQTPRNHPKERTQHANLIWDIIPHQRTLSVSLIWQRIQDKIHEALKTILLYKSSHWWENSIKQQHAHYARNSHNHEAVH
jgi:hypothetical protein